MNSEQHPWSPFLPANARVLMLGGFHKRIRFWSMEFFYPNLQVTRMWRIVGLPATDDVDALPFVLAESALTGHRAFCREPVIAPLYDTAVEVLLKDNASDNFYSNEVRGGSGGSSCWRIPRAECRRYDGAENHRHATRHYELRRTSRGGVRADALCGPGAAAMAHASLMSYPICRGELAAEFTRKMSPGSGIISLPAETRNRRKIWLPTRHQKLSFICINYTIFI